MTYRSKLLGAAGFFALTVLGTNTAFAAGTTAGATITNNVSVSFQVGGISQTGTTASDTLTVDRKINLTVAEVGSTTTVVTPGATSQVTSFTVTNTSNAVLDFTLAAAQQTGGAGAHANTDSFNVTNIRIFRDANANGNYDAGTDTLVTYVDELGADQSATLFVVADVPLALANGSVAAVTLTATGREGGTSGSQGAALVQTTGANTAAMDTVFADLAGATDAARDAAFSAKDDYTISAATLSAVKTSKIISDPINGTTNPKMIPGATIQYCIAITNAAGTSATATSVTVSDPIPSDLAYDAAFGVKTNGTVTSGNCNADTTGTGTQAAGTVTGTIASIAAGETKTVLFQATID
ncbi:hypothetical protein [Novosphingobium sp. Chol11]|uniref:hypothetical protein n=1 Tax=Novosphingobium sp. Chol11 TaxID=1385763 RepID=UPI0025F39DA6|nr:hypothetical protein [Novosphingobium sp. Chol11]